MFSRPPGKFLLTSNILHLYLNTAEHSFLLRDVIYTWVGCLCYRHFCLIGCLSSSICYGCLLVEFAFCWSGF